MTVISIRQGIDLLREAAELDPNAYNLGFQAGAFAAQVAQSERVSSTPPGQTLVEGLQRAVEVDPKLVEVYKTGPFAVGSLVGWIAARNGFVSTREIS